jgi:hypothetical protein
MQQISQRADVNFSLGNRAFKPAGAPGKNIPGPWNLRQKLGLLEGHGFSRAVDYTARPGFSR